MKQFSFRILFVFTFCAAFGLSSCQKEESNSTPQFNLFSDTIEVDYIGTTTTFSIETNQSWEIAGTTDWCSVDRTSGNGFYSLTLTVTPNDGEMRHTKLQITAGKETKSIYVYQWGDIFSVPDAAFRNFFLSNGYASATEGDKIKINSAGRGLRTLNVTNLGIESLAGIENLTLLQYIFCDSNLLTTTAELWRNSSLITLNVAHNRLTEIDLDNNTMLQNLDCSDNLLEQMPIDSVISLKTLAFSNNQVSDAHFLKNMPLLEQLSCDNNRITSLDLSKNPKLSRLVANNNRLSELATGTANLSFLACQNNELQGLTLSAMRNLQELNCSDNQLASLDLSKNGYLLSIQCQNNNLTALDLTACTVLNWIDCSNNQLTDLQIPGATGGINTSLDSLSCNDNLLEELDVSPARSLQTLRCLNNPLETLRCYLLSALSVAQIPETATIIETGL